MGGASRPLRLAVTPGPAICRENFCWAPRSMAAWDFVEFYAGRHVPLRGARGCWQCPVASRFVLHRDSD